MRLFPEVRIQLVHYLFLFAGLSSTQTIPDTTKCGQGQGVGCLRNPSSCVSENCTSILTWEKANDRNYIKFQLMAISDGWVAVGLSKDKFMGNDSVIHCIRNGANVTVGFSYNQGQNNTHYTPMYNFSYLSNPSSSYINGRIVCSFLRSINGDGEQLYSLFDDWYLLLAYGPSEGGAIRKHSDPPKISAQTVNVLTDFFDVTDPLPNSTSSFTATTASLQTSSASPPPSSTTPPFSQSTAPYRCTQPLNCVNNGSSGKVTFSPLPGTNQVLINMTNGAINGSGGWMGVGFSNDRMMSNDSVVDCKLLRNGTIIVENSYNIGNRSNTENLDVAAIGLEVVSTTYQEGVLQCIFKRNITMASNSTMIFNLTKPYHILIAYGEIDDQGVKQFHQMNRYVTPNAVDVSMDFLNPRDRHYFEDGYGNIVSFFFLNDSNEIEFEIEGPVNSMEAKWISLGFSPDGDMGNSSVVDCLLLNGTIAVQHSYNIEDRVNSYNVPINSTEGLTTLLTKTENGRLYCGFRRKIGNFQDRRIFSLDNSYFLLLAYGVLQDNEMKSKHNVTPAVSATKVDIRKSGNVTMASTPPSLLPGGSNFRDSTGAYEVWFKRDSDGQNMDFILRGSIREGQGAWWVAVGFSLDNKMGNDSVLDCIRHENGTFTVQNSYNAALGVNNVVDGAASDGIILMNTSFSDGFVTCYVKRAISSTNPKIYSFNQVYYLLLARGPVNGEVKLTHTDKIVSQRMVNVTSDVEQSMLQDSSTTTLPSTTPTSPVPATESPLSASTFQLYQGQKVIWLSKDNQSVEFNISGPVQGNSGYIAVGFSKDRIMGDDSVLDCILNPNGSVTVQNSYSDNKGGNDAVAGASQEGITVISTNFSNGMLSCRATRAIASNNSQIFPFDRPYFLLLAAGPLNSNGQKTYHGPITRDASKEQVNLTGRAQVVSGESRRHSNAPDPVRLLRAHGVLMVTAFVMLMSSAIIVARYYKTCWPDKKICGTGVWFAIHRFLMVLGLFCCAAGFIIIFCYGDGYIFRGYPSGSPSYYWAHGPMGIAVMILIVLNPIIAIFRCDPDSDNRWIFNWLHWFVGFCCHILAGITLFFGVKMGEHFRINHFSVFWILIAFVGFHVFIEVVLAIERLITQRQTRRSFTVTYGMSSPGETLNTVKHSEPSRESLVFRYFVLAFYILITMGLWLAMIILIGGSFHAGEYK